MTYLTIEIKPLDGILIKLLHSATKHGSHMLWAIIVGPIILRQACLPRCYDQLQKPFYQVF